MLGVFLPGVWVACGEGQSDHPASTSVFSLGGTVSGLSRDLVLASGRDNLLVVDRNGPFPFARGLGDGDSYQVAVARHPAGQQCQVVDGEGAVSGQMVTAVTVVCTPSSVLLRGRLEGAVAPVTLTNDGAERLILAADGAFSYPAVAGSSLRLEARAAGQSCQVSGGGGLAPEAGAGDQVRVVCRPALFGVGGWAAGLEDGKRLTLTAAGQQLQVDCNGSFTFGDPLFFASAYQVAVVAAPPGKACVVAEGAGTVPSCDSRAARVT